MNKLENMIRDLRISNKLQIKHLKIISGLEVGQLSKLKLGGTQGYWGQTPGQYHKYTRRGVAGNQGGGLLSTGLLRKPPPSGGGGDGSVQQGTQMSLQPTLGPCGGKGKNHKNKRAMGT